MDIQKRGLANIALIEGIGSQVLQFDNLDQLPDAILPLGPMAQVVTRPASDGELYPNTVEVSPTSYGAGWQVLALYFDPPVYSENQQPEQPAQTGENAAGSNTNNSAIATDTNATDTPDSPSSRRSKSAS